MKNRLESILKNRGIKKTEFAKKIGIHRNGLNKIINGSSPHLDIAHKIAKTLELSIYDIWELN